MRVRHTSSDVSPSRAGAGLSWRVGRGSEVVVYSARSHVRAGAGLRRLHEEDGHPGQDALGGNIVGALRAPEGRGRQDARRRAASRSTRATSGTPRTPDCWPRSTRPEITANIPAHLRDPENRWTGLTVRARTIMYNTKKVKPEELSTYEALGDPKWKNRICLRTSALRLQPVAARHHDQALRRAEDRGDRARAGSPTSRSSSTATRRSSSPSPPASATWGSRTTTTSRASWPRIPPSRWRRSGRTSRRPARTSTSRAPASPPTPRTARTPVKLIEFLTTPGGAADVRGPSFEYPANPQAAVNPVLAKWGKFKQDDINIAAAGEFQAAATKLADRAGYK